jgi:putative transposase
LILQRDERISLIDHNDQKMSVIKQANMLTLNRTSLYYKPVQPSEDEIKLKHAIDRIYTADPCFGSRTITTILQRENIETCRSTVQRCMREMGLIAIYPGPNLSKRNHEHKIYPYLLRNLQASYPNHIWGTDITYIRLKHGWLYLVAYLDWFSRYVVSWELSDNLEVDFVLSALEVGLKVGTPIIANSDQGCQFTSRRYTDILIGNNIHISMDGRGRALDNIFTERLWRTVKYQEVYLNDYESPREARQGLAKFLDKYNTYRPHQSLKNLTPAEVYFGNYSLNDFK